MLRYLNFLEITRLGGISKAVLHEVEGHINKTRFFLDSPHLVFGLFGF